MITTPTVLVLGAGASVPYGFPTARELKTKICQAFENENSGGCAFFDKDGPFTAGDFLRFQKSFRQSAQVSIDAFLEHRNEFHDVGKLAIAYCLMPCEQEDNLFAPGFPAHGGDWYEYLSGKLDAPLADFHKNAVSVVTFNYDRSLEHYLLTALMHSHGIDMSQAANVVAKLPIIHVYGQLGLKPYPATSSHAYHPSIGQYYNVERVAQGIRLMHEAGAEFAQARAVLFEAKLVCFLGFGYHRLNLSGLKIDTKNAGSKKIWGTALGMRGAELSTAKSQVNHALGSSMKALDPLDSLELLKEYGVFDS